jgi:hypothetical protein
MITGGVGKVQSAFSQPRPILGPLLSSGQGQSRAGSDPELRSGLSGETRRCHAQAGTWGPIQPTKLDVADRAGLYWHRP